MKPILFIIISLGITTSAYSQGKLLTARETETAAKMGLTPATLVNMQWRGNSSAFTFQDKTAIYQWPVHSADPEILISLKEINQLLRQKNLDTLQNMPVIKWENENEMHFQVENLWINIDILKKEVIATIALPNEAENIHLFYPARKIAYTLKNNLYINGSDNKPIAITTDHNPEIVNGQTVSRNEFGISEGIFWSPSGNYIAYYRKDESQVGNYPLVDITTREASLNSTKYPMAGMSSEHISLGVYQLTSGKTVFMERKDSLSEKYLTNISWDPNEQYIYIQVLNRGQDTMKLNQYKVMDGSLAKTLFEENNEKYVEPLNPILFLHKNQKQFIYQSRNSGFNHAYLYNADGSLIKQITSGNWEITEIIGLNDNDELYYYSTEESPLDQHPYKINLTTLKKVKLSRESGTHTLGYNPSSKYLIDDYSNISTPHIINIIDQEGKIIRNVLKAKNPLAEYDMPNMKFGTIKAADGVTDLYYRIIKPLNFDSTRHYPAVVYLYGGPHDQLVKNRWLGGARLWDYMMAQKGFLMFTIDNRGSANRGLKFENVIHRQCGVNEMNDQMEGIKFLSSLGYVDMNKLGIHGWSYGGFMTISMIVNHPDVFKVAVAGGPVIDWKYYEVMYGERYMDKPQENPDGYSRTSLLGRARDVKARLLIIHGGIDPTVVTQNSLTFVQECIKYSIPVDYFIYPRAEHNVRGTDRIHLMDKVTRYFMDNLK